MKITKTRLKEIIKEEVEKVLKEDLSRLYPKPDPDDDDNEIGFGSASFRRSMNASKEVHELAKIGKKKRLKGDDLVDYILNNLPPLTDVDEEDIEMILGLKEEDLDELMDSGPMHPDDDGRDLRPKKKDEDK